MTANTSKHTSSIHAGTLHTKDEILGRAQQLSGISFVAYSLDALSLERLRTCPHCSGKLSLSCLEFIDGDPLFRYRYEMLQEDHRALLQVRVKKGEPDDPGCGVLEDYTRSCRPLYSLEQLDRQWWGSWYADAHQRWPNSEVFTLEAWLTKPWLEPVVIAEKTNGQPELWLGTRTGGIMWDHLHAFLFLVPQSLRRD